MKHLYLLLMGLIVLGSCSKDDSTAEAVLEACFEINKDTVSVGENLQLTGCSKGASTVAYTFGNGMSSTDKNPVIAYQDGGDFNIELTVTNEAMETETFSQSVFVLSAESNYIYPDIPAGFDAVSLETGINPANGNIYSIELLEDNLGSGGSKFYYNELDASFAVTSNYIADKPFESNSAFVNFYPGGNRNFVFSRTLASLYGTQELTYNSAWGFINAINSATKHSYGYLPDGSNFLYFGTAEDGGIYKTSIERRNSSGDAFEVFLNSLGSADAMIGDMIASGSGFIAFGAVFTKNSTAPQITGYQPAVIFFDSSFAITSHVIYSGSVLDGKISSPNDLNGSYHLAELSNGNLAMYGNGELIVADASGTLISSTYFEGTKSNQALISLGDSFILSSENYLRKFDANGNQLKALKYNGNYLPEILEISNTLFFAAGFDTGGEIKMFYGASDKELNLINLNL